MSAPQVLIVGAGPTGLVLALCLAHHKVPFRIIDKAAGPGEQSRALVVQARTLEFYRQLGIANEALARGIVIERVRLRREGKLRATISLGRFGEGLSPYAFIFGFAQDAHERFLVERLAALGTAVEWNTELKSFSQDAGGVTATLSKAGTDKTVAAPYLAGCDGARSIVRQTLGLGFPGGTYSHLFYVADVKTDDSAGAPNELAINLAARSFALMLPVRTSGMLRLIGIVPDDLKDRTDLTFEDIRPKVEPLLNVKVTELNWFSTYHVHHRVAEHFKVGRCFLSGDAGHIHSPAGGQGMNTGIGDAVNLAWKLADVLAGRARASILDTYETERIGFARRLVATTDSAFKIAVSQSPASMFVRSWLVPNVLPVLTGFWAARREFFRVLSQTRIAYPDSALSDGKAGRVSAGDRLPWVADLDNFAPLASMAWQVHVYGEATAAFSQAARPLHLPVTVFAWSKSAQDAGLARNAAYLLRPDGHVALALPRQDGEELESYLTRQGLTF